jgi:hypothetical protein
MCARLHGIRSSSGDVRGELAASGTKDT